MIDILVPVFGRPQNAQPLVDSIRTTTSADHRVLFLCSPGDDEEIASCHGTGADVVVCPFEAGAGDYARKINFGYTPGTPWIFQAADDIRFHTGWDTTALALADIGIGVIGTNDLGNPEVFRDQSFSTHSFISGKYIDEFGGSLEGPGVVLSEAYTHNFVDRELTDIARSRGVFVFSLESEVEHLHPHWGKSEMDSTYERGLSDFSRDQRLYWKRSRRWGKELSPAEQGELKIAERQGIV